VALDAIRFVFERKFMIGTSAETFAPDDTLSRAMVATILYRKADAPDVTFLPVFGDVSADQWYSDAVVWAYQNDVVRGVGGGRFAPEYSVTREQFAAAMMRYAAFRDKDTAVPPAFDLANFTDHEQISDWALDAMRWAVYNNLIMGTSRDTLSPVGAITRAEAATVFARTIAVFAM